MFLKIVIELEYHKIVIWKMIFYKFSGSGEKCKYLIGEAEKLERPDYKMLRWAKAFDSK